jgi:hypothetical protein
MKRPDPLVIRGRPMSRARTKAPPVAAMTMRRALSDPALLSSVLPGDTWRAWRILLIAAMGEALTDDERIIFHRLTGRPHEPGERVEELWAVVGRRGGKSRAIAVLCVFIAALIDHSAVLVVGERPVVLCLAPSQKQAGVVFGYVVGILESVPMFAGLIKSKTAEILALTNGIEIEIRSASFRNVRGVTAVAVVGDEAAFWFDADSGSTNPDTAILDALRPALATTSGLLVVISSPYARRGAVYETWARHYGEKGDPRILVAQGASRDFNPSLPKKIVDRAMERDPASASAEYLGQWRSDLETFISREVIEAAVDVGVSVRPPRDGVTYTGFVDASSGSGKDSYTVGIAHADGAEIVLDLAHEVRPPFNPQSATAEIAALLKSYRIGSVVGDKYAAGFVIEAFAKHGVTYRYADQDRSQIYLEALPLLTSGRVRLVENARMVAQFAALERRTAVTGRDQVSHPRNGEAHDDLSNAVAGALVRATVREPQIPIVMPIIISKAEARSSVPESLFYVSGDLSAAYRDKRQQGFSRRAVF